jgi:hypothetical protein
MGTAERPRTKSLVPSAHGAQSKHEHTAPFSPSTSSGQASSASPRDLTTNENLSTVFETDRHCADPVACTLKALSSESMAVRRNDLLMQFQAEEFPAARVTARA